MKNKILSVLSEIFVWIVILASIGFLIFPLTIAIHTENWFYLLFYLLYLPFLFGESK